MLSQQKVKDGFIEWILIQK